MKKLAIAIFILFSVASLYSVPLTGFWGIPWETSKADAEKIILEKGIKPTYNGNGLLYEKINFANREGDMVLLFNEDKLYQASFNFKPETNRAYDTYKKLCDDMEQKYGAPTGNREEYKSPYSKNDGHTETAILMNYANISSFWGFDDGNIILITVKKNSKSNNIYINLIYNNDKIFKIVQEKKQKSVINDL